MPRFSPAGRRRAAACAAALFAAAGCAGSRSKSGVISAATDDQGGWRPRRIGLVYPQLAPGSAPDRSAALGTRPFMGSEITAVVHAALRERLAAEARPVLVDASAAVPARERLALLGTTMLQE